MSKEKPTYNTYNRFVDPKYDRRVNHEGAGLGRWAGWGGIWERRNPWPTFMFVLGAVAFIVGMVMYHGAFDDSDAKEAVYGNHLVTFGSLLMAGAMLAAAVCWQLRRSER
ncbi:hypothetical protein [Phytoactinopolyspora endophytica]|uniref:hypothetical protein n=1 Tax=Phytoactinopolyspora endophytica TaxID=1642495 RepID=UPI00101C5EF4|nr:hypothetical protein [Phytoactinopolyspora endophytica]